MDAAERTTPDASAWRRWLREDPTSRETLFLGIALSLLSGLPFLVAAYPQLTDYPSHLARYQIMLDGGHDPWLARYYGFEWRWTGNLGADILIWPLARLFGLEPAGRILGGILPPLTGFGILTVEWTLRRRIGFGSILALPLIWSPAMGMGFYNFCLSLALALFAFALWVRCAAWRWRWLPFLPIGLAVWLCHVSGWGVLGILVFGYEWWRRKSLAALVAPWPLALPVVPMLMAGGVAGSLAYGERLLYYKSHIWLECLRDQALLFDIVSLAIVIVIVSRALRRRAIDGRLGWAALLLFVATIVMPRHLGGGDFADYRLTSVCLMVACVAIAKPAPRWTMLLAAVFVMTRIGVTSVAWHDNSRKLEHVLKVLDHVPRGARVAAAVGIAKPIWTLDPFEHVPSYATLRRGALVNTHFAIPGVHMLYLKEGGPDFADPSHRVFYDRHEVVDLGDFAPARGMDYLWYVGDRPPVRLPAGARVIYRAPGTLLARLANAPAPR